MTESDQKKFFAGALKHNGLEGLADAFWNVASDIDAMRGNHEAYVKVAFQRAALEFLDWETFDDVDPQKAKPKSKERIAETCVRCRGWVWHRQEPCNCKPVVIFQLSEQPDYLEMIGKRIRATRESCGLTQDQLAAKAGMSKTGLWQIETGKSEPGVCTLLAIATVLEVSMDFLLLREG